MDSEKDFRTVFEGPVMEYAKELKEKGVILHIGMSSHNPHIALNAVESGVVDVLMFSINPAYDMESADTDIDDLMEFKGMEHSGFVVDEARQKLYSRMKFWKRLHQYLSEEERNYAHIFASGASISMTGKCMYCNYCQPCPAHLDIAALTKFLDLATQQETVPDTVMEHYWALSATADDCLMCGRCELNCPFGVKIRENMKRAREVFRKHDQSK